jgi:hypothetical protein
MKIKKPGFPGFFYIGYAVPLAINAQRGDATLAVITDQGMNQRHQNPAAGCAYRMPKRDCPAVRT